MGKGLFLVLNTFELGIIAHGRPPIEGPESSHACGVTSTLASVFVSACMAIKLLCAHVLLMLFVYGWLASIVDQRGRQLAFLFTRWSAVLFIPLAMLPHSSGMNCFGEGGTVSRQRQEGVMDG